MTQTTAKLRKLTIRAADGSSLRRTRKDEEYRRAVIEGTENRLRIMSCTPEQKAVLDELAARIEAAVTAGLDSIQSVNRPGSIEMEYDATSRKIVSIEKAYPVEGGAFSLGALNPKTEAAIRAAVEDNLNA